MNSKSNAFYSNISLVIGSLITFYFMYLSLKIPVKVINEGQDLVEMDFEAVQPSFEDKIIIVMAFVGIVLSVISYYKNELPKRRKYLAFIVNLIWFIAYISLLM